MSTQTNEFTAPELLMKKSGEKRKISMDFSNWLDTGVTILSTSVSSEKVSGEASDLNITNSTISGKKIVFYVDGGSHAVSYKITVSIGTSDDQTLIGDGMMRVLNR